MYTDIIGYEYKPISFFQGEDYPITILDNNEVGFGWFGSHIAHSIGHFASNAVKSAGREIGHVSHGIQSVTGAITKEVGKIPIVGGPLHTIFDVSFHIALGPTNMMIAVAIEGKRIDHVVLDNLKQQLHDFKQVAPYAQMVISVVPGVGQGVSAALSAGLALAEGQPIDEVLKAGLVGALPGGPLVKAAVTMGVETIQHVARGEKLDFQTFARTAGGIAGSTLGLPVAAMNALTTGISIAGGIAHGNPLDKTISDAAIQGLPISDTAKKAMTEASTISLDLAHGKKIDAVFTAHITAVAAMLPVTNPLHDSIKSGFDTIRKTLGKNEDIMLAALQSGLADTLVSIGAQPLSIDTQKAIKSGIALGSGSVFQTHRQQHLTKVTGKLTESGIQLSKTSPLFAEARKIAATKSATKGFDIATGLLQQKVGAFDIATSRNALDVTQKIGFDIACAVRIGAVTNPKPATLSPAAHAGHAITLGMQSYEPEKKVAIMQTIQVNPSATVGATMAVKEVSQKRESWLVKLLKALHLR